jgi:hypothetical protein
MLDWGGDASMRHRLLAETLGLAMARRAADILERHRQALTSASPGDGCQERTARFAADDAIFTAVLDAVNECLACFDARSAEDRWCDALLELILLARLAPAAAFD